LLLPFYQLPQADADAVFNFTLIIPPCAHAQLVLLNLSRKMNIFFDRFLSVMFSVRYLPPEEALPELRKTNSSSVLETSFLPGSLPVDWTRLPFALI
jgi:hypothetical protein